MWSMPMAVTTVTLGEDYVGCIESAPHTHFYHTEVRFPGCLEVKRHRRDQLESSQRHRTIRPLRAKSSAKHLPVRKEVPRRHPTGFAR